MPKHNAIYKVKIDSRFQVLHGTLEMDESKMVFVPNQVNDEVPEIRIEIEIQKENKNE